MFILPIAGPEETKNLAGTSPPPDSNPIIDVQHGKNLLNVSSGKPPH